MSIMVDMKGYIPRPLCTRRMEPFVDKGVIKVITGQHRTGKSYIREFLLAEDKERLQLSC